VRAGRRQVSGTFGAAIASPPRTLKYHFTLSHRFDTNFSSHHRPPHDGGDLEILMTDAPPTWTNWATNQSFAPAEILHPTDEAEYVRIVRGLVADGSRLRVAGSGHSFTPVVHTPGALLNISAVSGVLDIDTPGRTADILAGTQLRDIGGPLWDAGLAIKNQGDTDTQTIAGAVATGTKGSGKAYGSISSSVAGMTVVNGKGEVVEIDGSTPEYLRAARVSLGLLGAVTRVRMDLQPRYLLREHNRVESLDTFLENWEEYLNTYRHSSIFYCPSDSAAAMYDLGPLKTGDTLIKLLSEEAPEPGRDYLVEGRHNERIGRSHLVFPDVTTEVSTHVESEYQVDVAVWVDAFLALKVICEKWPEGVSPIQVRWQKADDAFLSPQYQRDTVAISISATRLPDANVFLRRAHDVLMEHGARPHWGKMHYATADDIARVYPELDAFKKVRADFDPDGLFLNDHLAELLGV
jgi:FAD/FMN-containing dehydrogenase